MKKEYVIAIQGALAAAGAFLLYRKLLKSAKMVYNKLEIKKA